MSGGLLHHFPVKSEGFGVDYAKIGARQFGDFGGWRDDKKFGVEGIRKLANDGFDALGGFGVDLIEEVFLGPPNS